MYSNSKPIAIKAHFTLGGGSLEVNGVDIARYVTKGGTSITFNDDGAPVLAVKTMSNATVDIDSEGHVVVTKTRRLSVLSTLAAAGIEGDDAVTSLDQYIVRAAQFFAAQVVGLSAADRNLRLTEIFGSDAVRAASVLIEGGASA